MYVESMGMSVGNMANTATANINTVRQAGTANAAPVKQPAADAGIVKQTGESISSIPAKQTVTSAAENTVRTESADTEQAKKDIAAIYSKDNDKRATLDEKRAAENEKIRKAIDTMRAQLPNSEVKFGIHERTGRVTIKVLDKGTKEVVREIPAEKTLDMIAKCMEFAGILIDEKM